MPCQVKRPCWGDWNEEDSNAEDSDFPELMESADYSNAKDEDIPELLEHPYNETIDEIDDSFFDHFGMDEEDAHMAESGALGQNNLDKWMGDSGASLHCCKNAAFMVSTKPCEVQVTIGDSSTMKATARGVATLLTEAGPVNLEECLYIPEIDRNIISLSRFAIKGHHIEMGATMIKVWSIDKKQHLAFKREGSLYYLLAKPTKGKEAIMQTTLQKGSTVDRNVAHILLGHLGHTLLEKTAKLIGWKLSGELRTCDACAKAKAIAKRVPKTSVIKETKPGERLYVDVSGPYTASLGGSVYWAMAVDGKTRKAFSGFMKKKSEFGEFVESVIDKAATDGHTVKYIRCDNAGENTKQLKEVCAKKGVTMEFTSPHTPQQNGVVERKFVTTRDMAYAVMLDARLTQGAQNKLWAEAVSTCTETGNVVVTSGSDVSADEKWYGKAPTVYETLQPWGRIGYVTKQTTFKKKFSEKSYKCICVGHAKDHAKDVYRMYNLETQKIVFSRDIRWADWHGGKKATKGVEEITKEDGTKPEMIPI
jgi:hypothetical protein